MTENEFEAGRVKFDQRVGPCVGDWYEMKDGSRYRFGLDLGERLKVAKDPSGKFFSLGANGVATYGGPIPGSLHSKMVASSAGRERTVGLACIARAAAFSKKSDGGAGSVHSSTRGDAGAAPIGLRFLLFQIFGPLLMADHSLQFGLEFAPAPWCIHTPERDR